MILRKHYGWFLFLLLIGVVLASFKGVSFSAAATTVSVDPRVMYMEPGEHFTVNVTIKGGIDVYGWQVNMTFDPNVVQYVEATLPVDHFLEGQPEGTTGLLEREQDNSIGLGCSIWGEYEGLYGSGTLVTIEFEVVATGESVLNLTETEPEPTFLVNSDEEPTYPGPDLSLEHGYLSNVDRPPVASFTYSPSSPVLDETITFNASASNDPDGTIVQYEWDFGDDTLVNETSPIATHVYTTAKTYTVTLTVFDNATASQKIKDVFQTTTMPRLWYETYSSYSAEVKFLRSHDLVIINVEASPTTVTVEEPVTISVTIENQGIETETFDVVAYYDDNTIATKTVVDLVSEESEALQFTWDTTGVTPDTYVIKVEAKLDADQNPEDNIYTDGTVTVKASETPFPVEYVIIGVVIVAVVIIAIVMFARRRGTSAS